MATAGSQQTICSIVNDGTLELRSTTCLKPIYIGVVVIEDKVMVIEWKTFSFQLYNRYDGKLISTLGHLGSNPMDVCLISETEVAVCLNTRSILIISFYYKKLVKRLETGFRYLYSLAKLNSDKLVVSGKKDGIMCWGILSITDGRMDSTHVMCEANWTHVAIKDNTVYISCQTDDSITNGVYAYDILNPHTQKFLYQHKELKKPWSIMADRDCVYVCDRYVNIIHQLTDSGQLVTIHTVLSSLFGIFFDDQHGVLYTTSNRSHVITVYKMESLHQSVTKKSAVQSSDCETTHTRRRSQSLD